MKMLIVGECVPDQRYELVDPSNTSETAFERDVAKALMCYRLGYKCIPFRGTFVLEGERRQPDLALVAPDYSHWYVIEVERTEHSLNHHVLPQVRAFRFGEWQEDCVSAIARGLSVNIGQAQTLLKFVPNAVVVVANRRVAAWESALGSLDVQLVAVSVFRSRDGVQAYEVDGPLMVSKESLGFATYSATDGALRIASSAKIPDGEIQLIDPFDGVGAWSVSRQGGTAWLVKVRGKVELGDEECVQLVRTVDGRTLIKQLTLTLGTK